MRAMTNGALSRFNPAQPGAQGMKVVATGLLVVMAAVFLAAPRARAALSLARLCQVVRRSGDGRRSCRLVRGHRPVPPPAGPAHPAYRDHPAQQGPHRRGAGQLPQGKFPHPFGRRAADAAARRRRRRRPLPADAAGEGTRIRAGASGSSPTSSRASTTSASAGSSRARSPRACAWTSRRCSATRSPPRSTRTGMCRCSRRRSAGRPARWTPTSC